MRGHGVLDIPYLENQNKMHRLRRCNNKRDGQVSVVGTKTVDVRMEEERARPHLGMVY